MYTVTVQWGSKAVTHTAWTLASANEWLRLYPDEDIFGTVTDCLGRTVAVKYYR
jgi:hypothetical protein